MSGNFQTNAVRETAPSVPSEAWLFAQALLGRGTPSVTRDQVKARIDREQLEWLASISSEHESRLRSEMSQEANRAAERRQLEWLAAISTRHEEQLSRVLAAEAQAREAQARLERLLEDLDLQEAQWDPSKHPRRGGPPNAGWFATTGGSGGDQRPRNGPGVGLNPPNPFRLTSASSKDHAIAQAAAKGDLTRLKDLINSGGLSAGERKAAEAAIKRLTDTAQNIISKELKGSVRREFPSDMLKMKLKDIMELAKGAGPLAEKARKALKLLKDSRFRK
jgi:hypothetical protein